MMINLGGVGLLIDIGIALLLQFPLKTFQHEIIEAPTGNNDELWKTIGFGLGFGGLGRFWRSISRRFRFWE